MNTISIENYLKNIFTISLKNDGNASTSQMAQNLNISNAATSEMAKKLANLGLVEHIRYKGVRLTTKGHEMAISILRKHRLWELFLSDVLNVPLERIHDEAEHLEHNTSDYLIGLIDNYLGHPKFDPHGHPIPQSNGEIPVIKGSQLLCDSKENTTYKVTGISDNDFELMKYLTSNNIVINTRILLKSKLKFDDSILIEINEKELNLSKTITENISVVEVEKGDME